MTNHPQGYAPDASNHLPALVPSLLTAAPSIEPPSPVSVPAVLPAVFGGEDRDAIYRAFEYFEAMLPNPGTRRNYLRAVETFCQWVSARGVTRLRDVQPIHVSRFIAERQQAVSLPTVIGDLAALRGWFNHLATGGFLSINPAANVKGPRYTRTEGKTPGLTAEEATRLLGVIDGDTLKNKRDRALLGLLLYSGCRAGAVSKMEVKDFYQVGTRFKVDLEEKGGQHRTMDLHHQAAEYLHEWVQAAGIAGEPKTPMFRTMPMRLKLQTRQISDNWMPTESILMLVKVYCERAGLGSRFTSHSFRVTAITNMLENGASREQAQRLAGHADARTTDLYDRRSRAVTSDIVEIINYGSNRPAARMAQP